MKTILVLIDSHLRGMCFMTSCIVAEDTVNRVNTPASTYCTKSAFSLSHQTDLW